MGKENFSRRNNLKKDNPLESESFVTENVFTSPLDNTSVLSSDKPAILGGSPVYDRAWPQWPIWELEDEPSILNVLRSGVWSRKNIVIQFEEEWANAIGAKKCLATVNGTNAIFTALIQSGVGAGDEVIVPPYTFVGTVSPVLAAGAFPIFVDTDRETFQIDDTKIEARITERTKAIIPVHVGGLPANMPEILKIAARYNLVVIEDACQAHLSEMNEKKMGTFGHAGCFSFQNSKNLPTGEGGAVVSDNVEFIDRCYSFHNFGFPVNAGIGYVAGVPVVAGTKLRFTEYQAAIGLAQLKRLEKQHTIRNENAVYLKSIMEQVSGLVPFRLYEGVTKCSYHLFPFRYIKEEFAGLNREEFIEAMRLEGVELSNGYRPLNTGPFIENAFQSQNFRRMYSKKALDYKKYLERTACPENDILCNEEAVWLPQTALVTSKQDIDLIVAAMIKIQKYAAEIKKKLKK